MNDRSDIDDSGERPPASAMPRIAFLREVKIFDEDEDFTEPSGLTMEPETGNLWAVSDDTERLFRLDDEGKVLAKKSFDTDTGDKEGIAWLGAGRLAVVRERRNEIVVFDADGEREIDRRRISRMEGYEPLREAFEDGPEGKGLEGITSAGDGSNIFIVKEGKPRLLLEISPDLRRITRFWSLTAEAGFRPPDQASGDDTPSDGALDVSGLAHDPGRGALWILSDAGRCVFLFDPETGQAGVAPLVRGDDDKPLKNAEGIALDPGGDKLHIVTDDHDKSRLVSYRILAPSVAGSA